MADDEKRDDREEPENDNLTPDGQNVGGDASERLDAVVLSIARLIGRQMAREDFAARIAANDNRQAKAADDD